MNKIMNILKVIIVWLRKYDKQALHIFGGFFVGTILTKMTVDTMFIILGVTFISLVWEYFNKETRNTEMSIPDMFVTVIGGILAIVVNVWWII